jgi:hypothetical protein
MAFDPNDPSRIFAASHQSVGLRLRGWRAELVRGERADELKPQMRLMVIIAGLAAIAALGVAILLMRAESQVGGRPVPPG